MNWAADFRFALFPYLVNGSKTIWRTPIFGTCPAVSWRRSNRLPVVKCQPIGHIGYYYPAEVWISEYGKLYAKYEYQDEIECFPDVFALIEHDLRQCRI